MHMCASVSVYFHAGIYTPTYIYKNVPAKLSRFSIINGVRAHCLSLMLSTTMIGSIGWSHNLRKNFTVTHAALPEIQK